MPAIYKAPDGAVFKTPEGKLIKEPYNFGNAFQNRMGLNNYIEINGLNIPILNFSYFYWYKGTGGNNDLFSFESSANSYSTYIYDGSGSISFTKNGGLGSNINIIATGHNSVNNGINLVCFSISNNSFVFLKNTNVVNGIPISSLATELSMSKLLIGAYSALKSIKSYTTNKINRIVIYNRTSSYLEMVYLYNNMIGNNIQSSQSLYIDLVLSNAEILDFSQLQDGSDMRVGCRDYSGFNRHGEIKNLPAGTLQQKLDYANANLFVPFIQ